MQRHALPILVVTVIAVVSSLPAWLAPVSWTPDGFFYQARMLTLLGESHDAALDQVLTGPLVANATDIDGPQLDRLRDAAWVEYTAAITQRRILVPLFGAGLHPLFGDFSLQAVSLLGYVALAPLLYLLLRRRFSVHASAIVAGGILLLPPLREWSFHPLTDSWGVTLEVACFLTAALVVDRGVRWLPAWLAAVAALSLTRDAAVIAVAGAAWLALTERTRSTVALAVGGALAAAPAPLLFGAPLGRAVGAAADDSGRYWKSLWEMLRIDVLPETMGSEHLAAGLALIGALLLCQLPLRARFAAAQRLAMIACGGYLAVTLVLTALLAIDRAEPAQQPPTGLVLLVGIFLLFVPLGPADAYLRLHRAGALACVAYLALSPVPSGLRLELAFLPLVAVGLARVLDGPRARGRRRLRRDRLTSASVAEQGRMPPWVSDAAWEPPTEPRWARSDSFT